MKQKEDIVAVGETKENNCFRNRMKNNKRCIINVRKKKFHSKMGI